MLPSIRTRKETVLFLGWTVGPFFVAFFIISIFAVLRLPLILLVGYVIPGVPLLIGAVFFVFDTKPKRLQWLMLVPYTIAYFVAILGVSLILGAITLAATEFVMR
jgi:hypothetical protein